MKVHPLLTESGHESLLERQVHQPAVQVQCRGQGLAHLLGKGDLQQRGQGPAHAPDAFGESSQGVLSTRRLMFRVRNTISLETGGQDRELGRRGNTLSLAQTLRDGEGPMANPA